MSRPSLPIGTRLALLDPEPPIGPPIADHERPRFDPRPPACAHCATCTGLQEGDEFPWNTVAVIAWDQFAEELICAPVTFSNVSSPRKIHASDLLDLYEVIEEGTTPDGWSTPIEEVVAA